MRVHFDQRMTSGINMEGCELGYALHDWELANRHNFHHDTIGTSSSSKAKRYCDNSARYLYNAFEFEKMETLEHFDCYSNS